MEVQYDAQKLLGERCRHGKQRKKAARSNDVSGKLSAHRQTRVDNAISRRETGKHSRNFAGGLRCLQLLCITLPAARHRTALNPTKHNLTRDSRGLRKQHSYSGSGAVPPCLMPPATLAAAPLRDDYCFAPKPAQPPHPTSSRLPLDMSAVSSAATSFLNKEAASSASPASSSGQADQVRATQAASAVASTNGWCWSRDACNGCESPPVLAWLVFLAWQVLLQFAPTHSRQSS